MPHPSTSCICRQAWKPLKFHDLIFVLDHQQLCVNQLTDSFHRMLEHVFSDGLQLDIEIVFLLEDLDQFKEHQGIALQVRNDVGLIVDLVDVHFTFFCKELINDFFTSYFCLL